MHRTAMAQDFYELLEVPDNASEVWIRRAYHRQREMLEQDATLDNDRRQSKIAAVEDAFAILSNPATRHVYDCDNLKLPEPEPTKATGIAKSLGLTPARLTIWGMTTLLVIGAAWAYWRYAKEDERRRVEEARGAAEVAAHLRDIETRDKAQRAAIEKIGRSIESQVAEQRVSAAYVRAESAETEKSNDDDVKRELAAVQAERTRVEQARRAEAGRRLRQSAGM